MEVKVKRTKEGTELVGSLPSEIANAQSLEIFPLRDGIYLLTIKGAIGSQKATGHLFEQERNLVKKLLAIKFEKRTPSDVDKTLSSQEKATLESLVEKKMVNVFRSGKYKNGVYNVSDTVFGQTREIAGSMQHLAEGMGTQQHANGNGDAQQPAAHLADGKGAAQRSATAQPAYDQLSRGYLVLENEGDARQLSSALAERIKNGEVSGLRAFDRKYYYIKKAFAEEWQPKITALLEKGDRTAEEVAREIGLSSEGCRTLLLHMSEGGELMEKGKGKFALA